MTNDDAAAQEERARRLRESIDQLKKPHDEAPAEETPAAGAEPTAPRAESPREFIHRKMRELDRKDEP
jgi:hypothetical protein